MDETGFVQNAKSRKVVAMKGSWNVWSRTVEARFHLTMLVAGSVAGFLVPPLFIVPGKRLSRDIMASCGIPGAKITTAETGFMTTDIMVLWIKHFARSVPADIQRPLMLVLDGAGSHMDEAIDQAAAEFGIVLVQLPPNASNLFQPLDVAVFKGVKAVLKEAIYRYMISTGLMSISKKDAAMLASEAWKKGVQATPENMTAGFKEAGIWSINVGAMQSRLAKFRNNGIPQDIPEPVWLAVREVIRSELLLLPPRPKTKQRRRKTVDVKRRLLTNDDLEMSDG